MRPDSSALWELLSCLLGIVAEGDYKKAKAFLGRIEKGHKRLSAVPVDAYLTFKF